MFKRILVPLDGSERAEQALPIATHIARISGGTIILLQVIDIATFSYSYLAHPMVIETSLGEVRNYLQDVITPELFEGIPTEVHVPFGSVNSQLLLVAESCTADSIIMTSQGYGAGTRWMLGSVAEFVVRHAELPVLLLREENGTNGGLHADNEGSLQALVPLDGSFRAKAALEPAAFLVSALSSPEQGTLHLTRIIKPKKAEKDDGKKGAVYKAERYLKVVADQIQKKHFVGEKGSDLHITWSVAVEQDAAQGIVNSAEKGEPGNGQNGDESYDLIAMATNGRSGLERWLMGSVTEGVLTKTRLPLLIVRPEDEEDKNPLPEPQEREFPLTKPTAMNPQNYLMAVIDDFKEAEDAVQSLEKAGILSEDIRIFERHELIMYDEHTKQTRSLRSRIADVFQAIVSDDDAHVLIYLEEALHGHAILNVYVPTPELAEQVKEILVEHHARTIKYFGRWAITILHH